MTAATSSERPSATGETIGPSRPEIPLWLAALAVIVAVLLVYWPVLLGQFCYWDDEETIRLNAHFDPPTWASLAHRWASPHLNIYVPLTQTAWHVLALISPKPATGVGGYVVAWPFKVASVAAHAATGVAVLLLLRRLVGRGWPALAAAVLFVVHPLQVEAVGWTSGLKDELFGLFGTVCLLAYVGGRGERERPSGRSVAAALACLVAAGLSKPTAMVLPCMMLALDLVYLRRPTAASVARLIPFAIVGVAFAAAAHTFQPGVDGLGIAAVPLHRRPLIVVDSLAFYLSKLVWPAWLAFDYGRTAAVVLDRPLVTLAGTSALNAALLLGLAAAAIAWRRRPILALGIAWFLLPLAPTLGLVAFDFSYFSNVADHYVYLAMLGIAVVVAGLLEAASAVPRRSRTAASIVFAVIAVLSVVAFLQARTWRDARSVSLRTLAVNPRSFGSWTNLALADSRAGDRAAAEEDVRRAMIEGPDDPGTLAAMGGILDQRGDLDGAIALVRRAHERLRRNAKYAFQLAELLRMADRVEEALPLYEEVARLDPTRRDARDLADGAREYLRRRAATRPASQTATQGNATRGVAATPPSQR